MHMVTVNDDDGVLGDPQVNTKTKPDAVKQEQDRNDDMIRSALRAVDALCGIRASDNSPRFKQFVAQVSPCIAARARTLPSGHMRCIVLVSPCLAAHAAVARVSREAYSVLRSADHEGSPRRQV